MADEEQLECFQGTTLRLITENFGPGLTFEKDVGQLMVQMGTEFVLMISSVGYEFAEKEGMTTIAPRHIIAALVDLGYGEYVDEIEELVEALKAETKRKKEKKLERTIPSHSGFSAEELLEQQTELFCAARARLVSRTAVLALRPRTDEVSAG
ncbi:negative cofactor 2 transcription regulator complex subunit ncb2 [Maublancomyces gigas]|uniref:Negative cofactor 2 transcription regulator complex subunit ncb2 n=1 Tax=Discina gigas TaxID=1032678 RepID=A0ABR3GG45_9PEZI